MRIVPAEMPVCSATSLMASSPMRHRERYEWARSGGHRGRAGGYGAGDVSRTMLVTGATGYVGGLLVPALLERGHDVRALARRPERADLPEQVRTVKGDVVSGAGLDEALEGVDVAFYLVHGMGSGNGPAEEFAERDRTGARNFARAAAAQGVRRIVYLGGLDGGEQATSEHLRSRE